MQQTEYLNNLDESQRLAVEYIEGPSLVIAGAGAGKTRVLTSKIAYLIDQGIKPWNILALTFTNKAAKEMRERIALIVGEKNAKYLHMGTFHSVFAKIIRREAPLLGYTPNYTIYDRADSTSLVKMIVKQMGLDIKTYKPAVVLSRISWAKNRLITADEYANNHDIKQTDSSNNIPAVGQIYLAYQTRLKTSDSMDFDDLLIQMYVLLTSHEEVRRKYVDKFDFVLVDEYQDTNRTQAKVLWLLTREKEKLCVVGDDAQSIYAFRGADIGNILNYTSIFPQAKLFKLERNYRSTRHIVDAANSLIAHNRNRIPKDVYSLADNGGKIEIYSTESDLEEAEVVTKNIIKANLHKGIEYEDIAVLYRKNSQSRVIEESLRKSGIPYRIYGGLSFYERKEIKDMIAYFRLVVNQNDDEAFRRIINYPTRGIGNTTLEKIVSTAIENNESLWQAVTMHGAKEIGISNATYGKVTKFTSMIKYFADKEDTTNAYLLGLEIMEKSGVKDEVISDISDISRKDNIEELVTALNDFVENKKEETGDAEYITTLSDYLADVALLTDADKNDDDTNKVTLMTIHSAKGLEFDSVFIVGAEEEIFPGHQAFYNPKEIEEERRLFYVALTRAKRYCTISFAHFRFSYGSLTDSEPSRFVKEINPACIEYKDRQKSFNRPAPQRNQEFVKKSFTTAQQPANFTKFRAVNSIAQEDNAAALPSAQTTSRETIKPGTVVRHTRFGDGVVKKLTDAGDTVKAYIDFHDAGEKVLLLKFAPLMVIKP